MWRSLATTRSRRYFTLPASVFIAAAFLTATKQASANDVSVQTVNIVMDEWALKLDRDVIKASPVRFHARNLGTEPHELVIMKTNLEDGASADFDGEVKNYGVGKLIGRIEEFHPGSEVQATFMMDPGQYVLYCNIVEWNDEGELESHYLEGMRAALTVER